MKDTPDTTSELTEIWSVIDRYVDAGHISDDGIDAIANAIELHTNKARIDSLQYYIDWIDRNHVQPENLDDRWCVASMEIVTKGKELVSQLQSGATE